MDKKKNIIIVILSIILILLVAFIAILITGNISIEDIRNKIISDEKEIEENNNTAIENILSDEEAESIVKILFTNDIVRMVFDNPSPYCDEIDTSKSYTENDLGLEETAGWFYYKCTSGSLEDNIKKVKEKFTEEYYNSNIDGQSIVTKYVEFNGKKSYFYYSVGDDLYITSGGKGGNINKYDLYDVSYKKVDVTEYSINYKVKAVWHDINNNDYIENINIVLVKEGDTWKIDKYDVEA